MMDGAWSNGLTLIESGDYWEAHESLERVWHDIEPDAARDAVQALIQFAAAAYKVEQAREGRDPDSMQRGMAKLIDAARTKLSGIPDHDRPMDVDALQLALAELEGVHAEWVGGASLGRVREAVAEIATEVVERLRDAGGSSQL